MSQAKTRSGGQEPGKGDKVVWRSHGGEAEGTVQRKITRRTRTSGRTVAASPDAPQYEVRSDRSGRTAVHKPSALRRKEEHAMPAKADPQETWAVFRRLVNMTPASLEKWLATRESGEAGQHRDGGESTGHASGRAIVGILRKKKGDLTDADYRHMRKANGYIRRHLAQRPAGDVRETRWRHSLMNWGHDPARDTSG